MIMSGGILVSYIASEHFLESPARKHMIKTILQELMRRFLSLDIIYEGIHVHMDSISSYKVSKSIFSKLTVFRFEARNRIMWTIMQEKQGLGEKYQTLQGSGIKVFIWGLERTVIWHGEVPKVSVLSPGYCNTYF